MSFDLPRITVRELIHERVRLELERLDQLSRRNPVTVDLTEVEQRLNDADRPSPITGFLIGDGSAADRLAAEKHKAVAEKAFLAGRYFVLLDDCQAEDLDEIIDLARTTEVTFLLLTPLKGG